MYDAMVNLLQRMDPTVFTVLFLVFGFTFGTAILSSIICKVASARKYEQELEFKREVLLRGIPAVEIERVLKAAFASSGTRISDAKGAAIRDTEPYQLAR